MVAVGDQISFHELQARWAYSEITSSRVGYKYRREYPQCAGLFQRADAGVPFEQLSQAEVDQLVVMNEWYRPGLIAPLRTFSRFICQSWTKDELARSFTVPALDPQRRGRSVPFVSFATGPRFIGPQGNPERTDPRVAADAVQLTWPTMQVEPVPVMPSGGGYILLDGYLRSILIFRSENPDDRLLVWVPEP
jgi:hypothetical protein